jgi:ankyrin repeat protein
MKIWKSAVFSVLMLCLLSVSARSQVENDCRGKLKQNNTDEAKAPKLTPFLTAIAVDNRAHVKDLIRQGEPINVPTRSQAHHTPLLLAAWLGRAEIFALLVENGADITARNEDGLTSLIIAAYGGNMELVDFALRSGALPDEQTDANVTALMVAAAHGRIASLNITADYQARKALVGDFELIVERLIEAGADVNRVDADGKTALMHAVANQRIEAVKILLTKGADAGKSDRTGNNPLSIAHRLKMSSQKDEIIKMLKEALKKQ